MSWVTKILGIDALQRQVAVEKRRYQNMITAAAKQDGGTGGKGGWAGTRAEEDALNKEYLTDLGAVTQRAQDLDVNNPDVRGFHRTRVAQILGKGVRFKSCPRGDEIGLEAKAALAVAGKIDRLRQIHSRRGGFDASGHRRSEGKQQERAMLTALVTGCCLIHRVGKSADGLVPFSIELIPGTRISTPYEKLGDPLVSYGIGYADEHRSRVTGYYVRRVSTTRGNSFIPDFVWDFVPVADGELLALTEIAGLDRAMPLSVANVRMLRNRGEMIESAVESARAQATIYACTEVEPGGNPYDRALDDSDEFSDGNTAGTPAGFVTMGNGVKMLYLNSGEKINWNSARLPDPDFAGFMDKTDERLARGFSASLSRFTRKVSSSWAGGRLEDQQDDPIIEQYRDSLVTAWSRVHAWFLESLWLASLVELPGYALDTRAYWEECRAEFPGKLHINPVDIAKARSIEYGLRTITPQQACEEDGADLLENLEQWAAALKLAEEIETKYDLEPRSLDFLTSGKVVSTSAGAEIAPDMDTPVEDPDDAAKKAGKKVNRIQQYLNRIRQEDAL